MSVAKSTFPTGREPLRQTDAAVGSVFITAAEALFGCRGLTSRPSVYHLRCATLLHPISAPGMHSLPRADEECWMSTKQLTYRHRCNATVLCKPQLW